MILNSSVYAASYSSQIQKSINFLRGKRLQLQPATLLTLDLLIRNYGVQIDTLEARRRLLNRPPGGNLRFLLRILDSRIRSSELEIRVQPKKFSFLPTALYCDVYAVPWSFQADIQRYGKKGGLQAVWGIMALAILQWQGCVSDFAEVEKLRGELAAVTFADLAREDKLSSLWFELMVSLYLAGRGDVVPPEYLKLLLTSQQVDGSWFQDDNRTVKALWILLLASEKYTPARKFETVRTQGF